MDQTRPCGCKGRRSCLICEEQYDIQPPPVASPSQKENGYVYCHLCGCAWRGWDEKACNDHPDHEGDKVSFPGVYIQHDFLDDVEKEKLLGGIRNDNWTLSQSGRRKQNYGPKCNFKEAKIRSKGFCGFPKYSEFVHDKLRAVPVLRDFQVIEQCVLEYDPKRGASIDPHVDDCWIWGPRIATVNVLGSAFLTMTRFAGDKKKYNLNHLEKYISDVCGENDGFAETRNASRNCESDVVVRIFMPEKSLIVLYGSARYEWEHCIFRQDAKEYRLCIAYREFTPPYITGEHKSIGDEIRVLSKQFW